MKGRPSKTLSHPNIAASSAIAGEPKCPRELDAVAKKKWKEIVALLKDAGTVTRLDGDLLAMYCEAHSRRVSALKGLREEGAILQGDKGSYQNPILHVANKAMDQLMKLSRLLGLDKLTARQLGINGRPPTVKTVAVRDRNAVPKNAPKIMSS